ncbi:unnamed protein product [Brachionus calyciflorus]|uniref:Uncharacterized protein n=1 Tax=Brachionus calyciflorus TaxID=104777 RepID=A0A813PVJ3_9BILA|nr:unnamed protein product [Brachionus calyciflorus]
MKFIWLYFLLFGFAIGLCFCDEWEYKLIHDILNGYDPSIRPSSHHNVTLNVTFGLALAQLIDVDERNMIITTNCWLNQGWIDHKLIWDPRDYDGIQFIHIPNEKIWKPDILLANNADSWAKISSISTNAFVKYDGNVTWLSTVIFKSSCSINVRYFPFDEQVCDMIFASWTYDGFFLDLSVNSDEGDVTNYIKNGEWHLVKLTATKISKRYSCCEEAYPEIHYRLIIRRRPLYYVFNMVFPCLLITLVAFLGFYLPPGSTEKISIGITTLLSLTVFLMLVAESMPPTSEQLPLLGLYYGVTIGLVSFSTAMAVITLNINNRGFRGKKVPNFLKIFFFKYMARILRTQVSDKTKCYIYNRKFKETKKDNLINAKYHALNTFKTEYSKSNGNILNQEIKSDKIPNHTNNNSNEVEGIILETIEDRMRTESKELFEKEQIDSNERKSNQRKSDGIYYQNKILVKARKQTLDSEDSFKFPYQIIECEVPKTERISKEDYYERINASKSNSRYNLTKQNSIKDEQLTALQDTNQIVLYKLEKLFDKQITPLVNIIIRTLEKNEKRIHEKAELKEIQGEWSDVALVADHFLCYFFPSMTLIICLTIFLNSPHTFSQW